MSYLLLVLAGLLLANGVPHFVAGTQGLPFQSPFAKPSGIGLSSPLVNVSWGAANLIGGGLLLRRFFPADDLGWVLAGIGALASATFAAAHFGKVRNP